MGFFTFGATFVLIHRLTTNKLLKQRLTRNAYKWPLTMAIGGSVASGIEYIRQKRMPGMLMRLEIAEELNRLHQLDHLETQQFKDNEEEIKTKLTRYRID